MKSPEETGIYNQSYFFHIAYSSKYHTWLDQHIDTQGGMSDSWALSWMSSWYSNQDIMKYAVQNLYQNSQWQNGTQGMWLEDNNKPIDIETSFYLWGENQYPPKNPRRKMMLKEKNYW